MAANLHTLQSFQAQQLQALLESATGQCRKSQAALHLCRSLGSQDRAVLVETGEQPGDVVQVGAEDVRSALVGDVVQHFAKLRQFGREFMFVRSFEHDLSLHLAKVLAEFAEHAGHPV